jgi:ATP-dependent DNA helicase RecQ
MLRFAQVHTCRRPPLLHYFGETASSDACGYCDNCLAQTTAAPQEDVTEVAQRFFTTIVRTGEVFGASHIIDILRGSKSQRVLERRHDGLPTYGSGKETNAGRWRAFVQQWIQQDLIDQDMQHGSLRLTDKGRAVLRGECKAYAEPFLGVEGKIRPPTTQGRRGYEMPAYDAGLFEHLRGMRRQLAQAANLPPYMIFSDRALAEMAAYLPQSPEAFAAINGVGRAKLETYGSDFVAAITAYSAAHGLSAQPQPIVSPRLQAPAASAPEPSAERHTVKRSEEIGNLFASGRSLSILEQLYGIKRSTVLSHLRDYVRSGGSVAAERLRDECLLPPAEQD